MHFWKLHMHRPPIVQCDDLVSVDLASSKSTGGDVLTASEVKATPTSASGTPLCGKIAVSKVGVPLISGSSSELHHGVLNEFAQWSAASPCFMYGHIKWVNSAMT